MYGSTVEAHGYYRAWVRPLPPRAASRLSGLVRRLRCFVPKQRHAQCRADLGQGPGHTLKNVHTTNHQSPITVYDTLDTWAFRDISLLLIRAQRIQNERQCSPTYLELFRAFPITSNWIYIYVVGSTRLCRDVMALPDASQKPSGPKGVILRG